MDTSKYLYIGVHGTVVALNRSTGEEVWRAELKGGDFVNVVLDGGGLYATTKGEIYAVNPQTGNILWHNTLPGMGLGLVTIASQGSIASEYEKRLRDQRDSAIVASGA